MSRKFARLIERDDTQVLATVETSEADGAGESDLVLKIRTVTPGGHSLTVAVEFGNPRKLSIYEALELFTDEAILRAADGALADMAPLDEVTK